MINKQRKTSTTSCIYEGEIIRMQMSSRRKEIRKGENSGIIIISSPYNCDPSWMRMIGCWERKNDDNMIGR